MPRAAGEMEGSSALAFIEGSDGSSDGSRASMAMAVATW
jgi:hypothetical protein